jgi:hypothetical protein
VPPTRTIIVPPFRPKGTLPLAAIVGGVVCSGLLLAAEAVRRALSSAPSSAPAAIAWWVATLAMAYLGPLVLLSLALSRRADRRWLTFFAGITAGTALPISLTAIEIGRGPPCAVGDNLDLSVPVVIAACAAIGGVVCLIVHWLAHTFLFTVVEDNGSYCLRCGYQIGDPSVTPPAITVCPECGAPRELARHQRARPIRLFDRARRAARPALAILAATMLIVVAGTVYRAAPIVRFLARFGVLGGLRNQAPGPITAWGASGPNYAIACDAAGAIQRFDEGWGKGVILVVRFAMDPPHGLPPMQIMLAVESMGPGERSISYGAPYVFCDLDGAQAEYVIDHGLPAPLVAEFRAASTRGWTPTPAPGPAGRSQPPIVRIDPTPYFPAGPAGR